MESKKAVTDVKVEPLKAKEALCLLIHQPFANRWAALSSFEGCDYMKGELETTLGKLQVAKGPITATSGHIKRHSSKVWPAESAVQERMKATLRNYIQK